MRLKSRKKIIDRVDCLLCDEHALDWDDKRSMVIVENLRARRAELVWVLNYEEASGDKPKTK